MTGAAALLLAARLVAAPHDAEYRAALDLLYEGRAGDAQARLTRLQGEHPADPVPAYLQALILAWVILRDHELSWPRGEMTAVVGMIAVVLVLYVGLVDRPGTPSSQISLEFGWIVALLGCAAVTVGGALRASGTERPRKPPGVL